MVLRHRGEIGPGYTNRSTEWGVKRPECEADHSPKSNADVNNPWSYTSTPPYVFTPWYLIKHSDNFTFYVVIDSAHSPEEEVIEWYPY
jgi:hypothetical protein